MKAQVVSRLTVLFTFVLVGCPKTGSGSGDPEGPLVFWKIDGQAASGMSNATHSPVHSGGTYTITARALDEEPYGSGIAETTGIQLESGATGCDGIGGNNTASTTGPGLTLAPKWRSTAKADGTLPDEWSESFTLRPVFSQTCPEGEVAWQSDPTLSMEVKDGAGNTRRATLVLELTSETTLSGSESLLEMTSEGCSRNEVVYLGRSGAVTLVRGDIKTFFVDGHDIYWYCADPTEADYEVTRCPTGTNLITVNRPSSDMMVSCYKR